MSTNPKARYLAIWRRVSERMHEQPEQGASMVEYALLLVLVLLVSFITIALFGETLVGVFETADTTFKNAPRANGTGTN